MWLYHKGEFQGDLSVLIAPFGYCPLFGCFMVEHWIEKSITYVSVHPNCIWKHQKDHFFFIQRRKIQSLVIKLYKTKENLSNEVIRNIFPPMLIKHNLRTLSDFLRNSVNISKCGLNSIRYFGSKVWQIVSMERLIFFQFQ